MHIQRFRLILLTAFLLAAGAAHGQAVSFTPAQRIVQGAALLSVDKLRPGDSFDLAFKATVRSGYHIGAHDKDALFQPELTIAAPKGITFDAPVYPKAVRKAFKVAPKDKLPVYEGTFVITAKGHVARNFKPGPATITGKLVTQGCKDDQCFPPETTESKVKASVAAPGTAIKHINADTFKPATASAATSDDSRLASKFAGQNLILNLLMLYGFGLLLAFTPCVYPMVPVTVGYFSAQGRSASRTHRVEVLAAIYVLGIALTYSVLGAVAAMTGGVFGAAMQSPVVMVGIALVLVALAASMFGLYEMRPPAFIESRASGHSGALGALVMGLIFGIVAAPCVGPAVLALLIYVAHLGSPAMGFLLFFVLALGLGTPLFLLATFSAKMPVAGMWMVTVKKVAGFLLLGAAAYFVGPIVPEPIRGYMVPAVVLAGGIYLFVEKSLRTNRVASSTGKVFGVAALVVAVMMVLPAAHKPSIEWQPYTPSAIAQAAKSGQPALVDFTAEWCGVCQELKHGPFSDPAVIKAAARFQRLRVDGTNRKDKTMLAAVKQYAIKGFPSIVFLDSSGQEIPSARVTGFADSKELIKRMKSVR